VPNWSHIEPPQGDPQLTRNRLNWPRDLTIALHSGNMGLMQGLENVVAAAKLAQERGQPVRFVLMGDGNQRRALESLGMGLSTLQFLPRVPSDEYADTLAAADLLIVNERVGVRDMSLPSKLTSYFIAGRPVVAAVHPLGATAAELERSGAGYVLPGGRPERLLSAVIDIANNSSLAKHLGSQGRVYSHSQLAERAALHRFDQFVEALTDRESIKRSPKAS
jgi:colanic acid biosynthesis glycosyl transferase WcaI